MADGFAPEWTSRPAAAKVSAVTELKRNQPVSVAIAANSGVAISGVTATPSASIAASTSRPVASDVGVFEH